MFDPMNLGQVRNWVTWAQKLGHQVKSKENNVNTLEVPFFKQSSLILLKMFVLMNLGQVRNWIVWGKKLGPQIKSKVSLVNTLAVTFLEESS